MIKRCINPPGVHSTPLFSRAISLKDPELIFLSGMTPADEDYRPLHVGDLRAQYDAVKALCGRVLESAGASWADVVHVRTYVTDMDAFMRLFAAGEIELPGRAEAPPCSTLIAVSRLTNPDFLVEIELVAALGYSAS